MSPEIFSRRIFRKWHFLKGAKEKSKQIGQAVLRDQLKPEDCETTPTISHSVFLPFELWQSIINNLCYDRAALCACSLTCKAFLHTSRLHIFHTIHLTNRRRASRFIHEVCFTSSPTCPCTYVRYLSMCEGEYCGYIPRFVIEVLPFLSTCLPNVTSLTFLRVDWTIPDDDAWTKILLGFPKVQQLVLNTTFETPQQANEFISSFPLLTRLESYHVRWKLYSELVIPLPRYLKSITTHSTGSHFLNQLLRLESHPDVCTLRLKRLHPLDCQAVGELLKTLGSHLEHLLLISPTWVLKQAVCENLITFAHNTHLRSIHLALGPAQLDISTLDWVATLFSQVTSHHVKDVWLQLPKHGVDLEAFLPSIERVFTQQHWSNLQLLQIFAKQETQTFIEACMPLLDSRGVVRLRDFNDPEVTSDGLPD